MQLELAQVISDAIMSGDNALLEAGTGTGKTFAYLLPGHKVIETIRTQQRYAGAYRFSTQQNYKR